MITVIGPATSAPVTSAWVIASPIFQLQNKSADGKAPQPKAALLTAGISQPRIRRTLWFADTIYLCIVNRCNQQEAP
jgi:hypothetical protein